MTALEAITGAIGASRVSAKHPYYRRNEGEEMRIDNTAQEKRKKKKQQTQLEQMIFSIIQASIKATVDEAMKEIFKELK